MNDKRTTEPGYSDPETLLIYLRGCVSRADDEGMINVPADYITSSISALTELQHRREAEAGTYGAEAADRAAEAVEAFIVNLELEDRGLVAAKRGMAPRRLSIANHILSLRKVAASVRAALTASPSPPSSGVRVKAWSDNFVGLQHWRDEDNEDALTLTRNDIISLIEDYRSALGEHP